MDQSCAGRRRPDAAQLGVCRLPAEGLEEDADHGVARRAVGRVAGPDSAVVDRSSGASVSAWAAGYSRTTVRPWAANYRERAPEHGSSRTTSAVPAVVVSASGAP